MRIVVTGASGFIGTNLRVRLTELGHRNIVRVERGATREALADLVRGADFVFHLAGVNRPKDNGEFVRGNLESTEVLCGALADAGCCAPVALASSTQAALDNPYGRSKHAAEQVALAHSRETGSPVAVFRLTNVFGKWARPHYNSAVATFCHQIARGLPTEVRDPAATLRLLYIDDLVETFVRLLANPPVGGGFVEVGPVCETTVGEVERMLREFADSRHSLMVPRVGAGLTRALYATYVSHLPPEAFAYQVARHVDPRGVFVEMLKTPDCGQFSYFTAPPGMTRGEHYHHSKTEKFLVIKGVARFGFRHIVTGEVHELVARGGEASIVDTVPGWTHNITNIGDDELIVMLWANETFDPNRSDTVALKVKP